MSSTKSREPKDPCSCPRPGHYPDTVGVSISAPRMSGWGVVGRWEGRLLHGFPGKTCLLLLDLALRWCWEVCLIGNTCACCWVSGGCPGLGGCRTEATGRPFPASLALLCLCPDLWPGFLCPCLCPSLGWGCVRRYVLSAR